MIDDSCVVCLSFLGYFCCFFCRIFIVIVLISGWCPRGRGNWRKCWWWRWGTLRLLIWGWRGRKRGRWWWVWWGRWRRLRRGWAFGQQWGDFPTRTSVRAGDSPVQWPSGWATTSAVCHGPFWPGCSNREPRETITSNNQRWATESEREPDPVEEPIYDPVGRGLDQLGYEGIGSGQKSAKEVDWKLDGIWNRTSRRACYSFWRWVTGAKGLLAFCGNACTKILLVGVHFLARLCLKTWGCTGIWAFRGHYTGYYIIGSVLSRIIPLSCVMCHVQ